MDPHVSLIIEGQGAPSSSGQKKPLQYYFVKQVIGTKDKKTVFMNKVLAVYPKGIKVVHATTGARTVKELGSTQLLKFVDIREFQYSPDKNIFRFYYRTTPSNDPLPLATDLQFEFELALVSELNKTIDLALERLAAKRRKVRKAKSGNTPIGSPAGSARVTAEEGKPDSKHGSPEASSSTPSDSVTLVSS